jgi:hypothetical protein
MKYSTVDVRKTTAEPPDRVRVPSDITLPDGDTLAAGLEFTDPVVLLLPPTDPPIADVPGLVRGWRLLEGPGAMVLLGEREVAVCNALVA